MVNKNIGAPEAGEPSEILTKPLPQILAEMEEKLKAAAEATTKADGAARKAEEAALKAEEAIRKAEEALPAKIARKVLASWEVMAIIILTILGSVFAAVAISLGLGLLGP